MYIRKHPAPPIGRLLRGAVFTTFYHRKVAPKVSAGHLRRDRTKAVTERRCRHPLLFAVLDLLVLLDQDKSTRRKKMHDRRNRFSGKNSDVKIGCVVSAGRRPWDTPTVAGLRRRRLQPARRKGPQYFKPDCGVSQGRNLACTARCSVNSRKVRSSRRFPPVPLRSDRHDAPPDKQREPFPMKRFPFSFPRRIPPDPA